ncbi:MAG: RNA degradosome polyphosphate kinase [Propionibacteriaceae bacterium]|jgi:polyphosphate kinase|nr:RNA degradosome polyphosphate kinase [Propionibacteriaceae bacterium]
MGETGQPLPELPEGRFSDRELSWLAFNTRVLDLAKDRARVPLLERARFLAIFSNNLDEFFQVRVGGLKRRMKARVAVPSNSGLLPGDLHDAILAKARELVAEQNRVFADELRPELAEHGIEFLSWAELPEADQKTLGRFFARKIEPVLTPLAVDKAHPFPFISSGALNLGVLLRNTLTSKKQFARIKVPQNLPRFVTLGNDRFLPLEEVIAAHLAHIFDGMPVLGYSTFRVTRNEDLEVEEDDAENLLHALESQIRDRDEGHDPKWLPVRLEVPEDIDETILKFLTNELDITQKEIFRVPKPLDLTGLFQVADLPRESLKYPSFLPKTHPELGVETARAADIFSAMRSRDILLQHPYDSFATSVQRFVEQAAHDPDVLAIKQTLYRTSGDSPIVDSLIEAAQAGKQVLVLVELKARFDEAANIVWAKKMERAGCHVIYGLVGLKTHCKLSLVVRSEGEKLRRYCHIGTGNYNPKTARIYEDLGLLTCNPVITEDVARVFNRLSGMSAQSTYRRLLVAPQGIRRGLIAGIENEIENHRKGKPARIRIKVNSIVDEAVTDALYRASQAGVPVDFWVRGICSIQPGIPGLSENIRVRSILGRFLEHSRLYWFENAGEPRVAIGSSDLMHRNLDRRIEVLVAINHPRHIERVDELFNLAFDDNIASWWLEGTTWTRHWTAPDGRPLTDIQEYLISQVSSRRGESL